MKVKMTLEQALEFTENHIKVATFNENSWCVKTAMAVMAEELKKADLKLVGRNIDDSSIQAQPFYQP